MPCECSTAGVMGQEPDMHHTLYLQKGDLDLWRLLMCSSRHLPTGFQGVTVPS